jgi:hypothetical protein
MPLAERSGLNTGKKGLGQKRVTRPFFSDRGWPTMAWVHFRFVRKWHKLRQDRPNEGLMISAWQVRPPDGAIEEYISCN